jgi:transcription elongation factor GreA-like protein
MEYIIFISALIIAIIGGFGVFYQIKKDKWENSWKKSLTNFSKEYPPFVSDDFQIGPDGAYEHVETELDFDKVIQENFEGLKDFIKDKDILAFYHDLIKHSIKYYAQEMIYPAEKVTRFEVIDHTKEMRGRAYVKYDIEVELSFQDDGRTLKVFVNDKIS